MSRLGPSPQSQQTTKAAASPTGAADAPRKRLGLSSGLEKAGARKLTLKAKRMLPGTPSSWHRS